MWMVLDSLTCPRTGTAFSCIYKRCYPKMFIWYESNISLCPGDKIMPVPAKGGMIVNDEFKKMTVYHATIFRAELWAQLYREVKCPEATQPRILK